MAFLGIGEKKEVKLDIPSDPKPDSVVANMESIKAKIEVLRSLREADGEQVNRLREQIGELRATILEKEKEFKDLAVSVAKVLELMKILDPERVLVEVKKESARYDSAVHRVDIAESKYERLIEEVKSLRRKVEMFKDVDGIIELNKDTRNNLVAMRTVEANLERHASKVERIFTEFQKNYQKFQEFEKLASDTNKFSRQLASDFDELKVKFYSIKSLKDSDLSGIHELSVLSAKVDALQKQQSEIGRVIDSHKSCEEQVLERLGQVMFRVESLLERLLVERRAGRLK